jgi:Zn-dependent protease with chaperone function
VKFDPTLPDDTANVSPTHPLREAATLIVGIAIVAVVTFAAIAAAVELLIPHISPALEARIFSRPEVVSAIVPGIEESPDPRTAEVDRLLDRLAAHWPDNPHALRVAIIDDATPNAFAFPGGLVAVTTGLLAGVASDNELAFVLAHEIGHFRNRDHLRGLGRGLAFAVVIGVFGIGGSSGAAELAGAAGLLAAAGFSRDQESAADGFGLALVQAEYGHVGGATKFFERLPKPDNAIEREIEGYLSTHPLSAERIDAMTALVDERGWSADGPLTPLGPGLELLAGPGNSAQQ